MECESSFYIVLLGADRFARLYLEIKYIVCLVHEIESHNSILDV